MRSRIGFTCLPLVLAGGLAQAAPPAPRPLTPARRAALIAQLDGADGSAAGQAAIRLGDVPEAHPALAAALAKGPPAPTAIELLAALARLPAPGDIALVLRYAGHRNPEVRGAAITALVHDADPAAQAAIVAGLHDDDAGVRAAAAQAAVAARLRAAIEPLTQLAARGEQPAADALAQLQPPPAGAK